MRLIDADKMLAELEEGYDDCDIEEMLEFVGISQFINQQPTAYDVDRVISNIWDKSELILIKHNCYDEVEDYIRTTDVTQIVRDGGIDG